MGVSIPVTKLYRARWMAKGESMETYAKEYVILRCYAKMVLKTNPGSVAKIQSKLLHTNIPPLFERLFLCFHGSATRFEFGCRLFLGFDGYHLKGPYDSILLVAIGLDANLQFFPVAFGIVEIENKDNWQWFLTQLNGSLSNVLETKKLSVLSDIQR